jgi:hypothetical protein
MDPDEATGTVLMLCATAPSEPPLVPMTFLACASLFMIRSPCASPRALCAFVGPLVHVPHRREACFSRRSSPSPRPSPS